MKTKKVRSRALARRERPAKPEKVGFTTGETWAVAERPRTLEDIIGQRDAVDILRGALDTKKLSKCYAFLGPTGTGKTTLARILGGAVNGWPSDTAEEPFDYNEYNVGDNRGIDFIREVAKMSRYMPQKNLRIIVLDEVHQLTPQAASALLKPIEDAPATTIFLLCSSKPEQMLIDLLGRCAKIMLTQPDPAELLPLLRRVAKKHGSKLAKSDKALTMIANAVGGQPRDALQLLYNADCKIRSTRPKNLVSMLKEVRLFVQVSSEKAAVKAMAGIYKGRLKAVLEALQEHKTATEVLMKMADLNSALLYRTAGTWTYNSALRTEFERAMVANNLKPSLSAVVHVQNTLLDMVIESRNTSVTDFNLMTGRLSRLTAQLRKAARE